METMRTCGACGARNPTSAAWCGQCHVTLPADAAAVAGDVPRAAGQARARPGQQTPAADPPGGHPATPPSLRPEAGNAGLQGWPATPRRRRLGERARLGLRLVGVGFRTAWQDPRLLAAPAAAVAVSLAVLTVVASTIGVSPLMLLTDEDPDAASRVGLVIVAVSSSVVTVLAQAVVVAGATQHFAGGLRPGEAWRTATARLPSLAAWALVELVVGAATQATRRHAARTGSMAGALGARAVDAAWTTLTLLVVPVILYEDANPARAVKRSTGLFRRVWGQQLVGTFGLGLAMSLLTALAVLVAIPLALLDLRFAVAIAVLLVVGLQLVGAVAGGAFKAALYAHATAGELPEAYEPVAAGLA